MTRVIFKGRKSFVARGHLKEYLIFHRLFADFWEIWEIHEIPQYDIFHENLSRTSCQILDLMETETKLS